MSGAAYRRRIAASKAGIEADVRALADRNPGLKPGELQALALEKLNVPITLEFAAEIVGR